MKERIARQLIISADKQRDPEAFGALYDAYVGPVYRFIYFKVSSEHDAQDLTSEVFLKVWASLRDRSDEIKNIRAFIYKVARTTVIDFYRGSKQSVALEEIPEQEFLTQTPLASLADAEELQNVLKAVRMLKEEYKELIVMRFVDELSYVDISKIVGKSLIAVRVTTHRALTALKKILQTKN